jgi:hypothetical protein
LLNTFEEKKNATTQVTGTEFVHLKATKSQQQHQSHNKATTTTQETKVDTIVIRLRPQPQQAVSKFKNRKWSHPKLCRIGLQLL